MRVAFYYVAVVLRMALGALFLWSSLRKLNRPYDFLSSVYAYELVGPEFGRLIADWLPFLELVLGVTLLAGVLNRGSLFLSTILLAGFTFVKFTAAGRDAPIPCGCGTPETEIVTYREVVIVGTLTVLSLLAWWGSFLGESAGTVGPGGGEDAGQVG